MSTEGTVSIIGLGYIGLPTAAALATRGVTVHGVDVNEHTVASVSRGEVPFVEPDLAASVSGAVAQGKLKAATEVDPADAFIIAVPTPFQGDHEADLSYIRSATESIAPVLSGGELVILESTSPPGTTRQIAGWLSQLRPDLNFPGESDESPDVNVAHCPERVLPGRIMIEIVTNDRIVGGLSRACARRAADLYEVFCQGEIVLTDAESAELSKLVENSFRDVNIAFANELSVICDKLGVDVWEVIEMANRHPRVNILQPGPGVGGHCIAVDPWFIVDAVPEEARLIRTAREVNDAKPRLVASQVVQAAGRFKAPTIAFLGLAFKANVDDLRESPAVQIVDDVAGQLPDAVISAVEPHVENLPQRLAERANITLRPSTEAIADADIVVLLVDHDAFKTVRSAQLSGKISYDIRGLWRPDRG